MLYKVHLMDSDSSIIRYSLISDHSFPQVENACYTVKLRGSEIPKHMLAGKLHNTASHEHTNLNTNDSDLYDI